MGEIIGWIIAVISACIAVYTSITARDAEKAIESLESDLAVSEEQSIAWQNKYDALVQDIKKVAMRPQYVAPEPEKPRKARSAAEIRRMNDQMNAKELADRDQAAG